MGSPPNFYGSYQFRDTRNDPFTLTVGFQQPRSDSGYLNARADLLALAALMIPLSDARLAEVALIEQRIPLPGGVTPAVAGKHIEERATFVWGDFFAREIGFSLPAPKNGIFDPNDHDVTMTHADVLAFMSYVRDEPILNMQGETFTTILRGYHTTRQKQGRR